MRIRHDLPRFAQSRMSAYRDPQPTFAGRNASLHGLSVRLTLLAPDIIEEILDGRTPALGLDELLNPMTPVWSEQRALLGYS